MLATNWQNINQSLLAFIKSKINDEATAKDILQEVFLKVQLKSGQLKDESKLIAWVFQIARNTINDYFRKQKRNLEWSPIIGESAQDDSAQPNQHKDFSQCIPRFLDALPDKYRDAVYLVEIEGLSQKELAERLNISYSGAKSRVQRGREKLKEALLECCRISTDVYGNIIDYQKRECPEDC